jgi:hypothetical protein
MTREVAEKVESVPSAAKAVEGSEAYRSAKALRHPKSGFAALSKVVPFLTYA